jgi:hypothetical protein
MDFLLLLLIMGFAFWLGWNAREAHAAFVIHKWMEDAKEEYDNDEEYVHVSLEKHDGVLFCYDKESKRFITQATNREELEKNLSEIFPGKKFAVSSEDLKAVGFK